MYPDVLERTVCIYHYLLREAEVLGFGLAPVYFRAERVGIQTEHERLEGMLLIKYSNSLSISVSA